jgi:hypothetical protein
MSYPIFSEQMFYPLPVAPQLDVRMEVQRVERSEFRTKFCTSEFKPHRG